MQVLIDWVSFTMSVYRSEDYASHEVALKVNDTLYLNTEIGALLRFDHHLWQRRGGRPPYSVSWSQNGIAIYAGIPNTILIEVSGQGCEYLRHLGVDLFNYDAVQRGVTRVDLAADMPCETSPDTFVECATKPHVRASGRFVSDSGHTCYVGSKKSDRYARVYRYSPPHPRSGLLRCEMVLRHEQAKNCALYIRTNGLQAALFSYGDMFGWKHPEWKIQASGEQPKPIPNTIRRSSSKTVAWLIRQAAPAFKKCVDDGSISDPSAFIKEHFLFGSV